MLLLVHWECLHPPQSLQLQVHCAHDSYLETGYKKYIAVLNGLEITWCIFKLYAQFPPIPDLVEGQCLRAAVINTCTKPQKWQVGRHKIYLLHSLHATLLNTIIITAVLNESYAISEGLGPLVLYSLGPQPSKLRSFRGFTTGLTIM